jgi:hypothetical protein
MPSREKLKQRVKAGRKRRSRDAQKSYERDIKQRRRRLLAQIEEFDLDAQHFLHHTDNLQDRSNQETFSDNEEDEDDQIEDEDDQIEDEDEVDGSDMESDTESDKSTDDEWENGNGTEEGTIQPENISLQLPSTLGQDACAACGKKGLMEQEIELRTGQANDALSQIRAALGYKSFLFREKFRNAENYKIRTRSRTAITSVDQGIQQNVTAYSLAFRALTRLGSKGAFKPIKGADLKMNSNILQENRFGQSKVTLSWIWRTGVVHQDEDDAFLQEGKQYPFLPCSSSQYAH